MAKARLSSTVVLFLGFSALLLFGGQLTTSDDSSPGAKPEVYIPPAYQATPSYDLQGEMSIMANVTKTFMPQDEDTSCTVMFIYNPTLSKATIKIAGYDLTDNQTLNTSFVVPKKTMVRICSDTVSTISDTWQNVILINFRTYVTHAKITYPGTCKITAYVAWNNSNTYDPLATGIPTLPISFY